ncbi:DUF4326 domain-containing protein [Rhodobacter sp. NSM]|uniref:DUF4326 domain-containing protein n=1 Tax=Rhodobacter sp. NSM TaxID=3457501 RepID=UPI003FD33A20
MADDSTRQGRRTDVPAASAGTAPPATGSGQDTGAAAYGKPQRIQLSRAKGWRMPPGAVKVDRSTRWGNPWSIQKAREVGYSGTDAELAALCVGMFRNAIQRRLPAVVEILENIHQLRGQDLACWCPPSSPCHADVLLEIANG